MNAVGKQTQTPKPSERPSRTKQVASQRALRFRFATVYGARDIIFTPNPNPKNQGQNHLKHGGH